MGCKVITLFIPAKYANSEMFKSENNGLQIYLMTPNSLPTLVNAATAFSR